MPDSPVIFIQCDWDDFLRKTQGSLWVSLKKRGDSNNIHGKITNAGFDSNESPTFLATSGFSAEVLANDMIKVEHKQSQISAVFVAPTKVYTDIHKKSIPCLDVTTTGLCVSYCVENNLVVWDFNKEELKLKLEGHVGEVYKCKFFPSERVVLTGGGDMQLKIWCAETGRCPVSLKGHRRAVTDFVIIDVGRNVISVSKDGSAKLWDCGQSSCIDTLICTSSEVNCCAITSVSPSFPVGEPEDSPSEREIGTQNKILILGCEDGTVHSVAVYSRRKLFTLVLKSPVNSVAFLETTHETDVEKKFVVGCQNECQLCLKLLSWKANFQ
ncbi:proteasomal ATPase-associated factor 1-like isoform X2 [Lycorma delicatula]|uniref:proteasomal ATPase-associated factor 1-like isoform X2 n=1 Tax=Lycorma delicatula TaxID=130591 RepID=UPI003F518EC5